MEAEIRRYIQDLLGLAKEGGELPNALSSHPPNYVRCSEVRNEEICALRAKGDTLKKIGDAYGISTTRVAQIVRSGR